MKPTIRYLLVAMQILHAPVTSLWSNPDCTDLNIYRSGMVNREAPYLTGQRGRGYLESVSQLSIPRDITEDDNLTITYTVDEIAPEPVTGVPFCMENTSIDVDGSMVKILRLGLKVRAQGCPIKATNPGTLQKVISIWGLKLPDAPPYTLRINITLVDPALGAIMRIYVNNFR